MGSKFWGVDFGTTTTYLSSSAQIIDNLIYIGRGGLPFIPSVAGFDADSLLYCEDTARLDEEFKVRSIKYLITRGLGKSPIPGISEATDLKANRYRLTTPPSGAAGQWLSVQSSNGPKDLEVGAVISGILRTMIARADLTGESVGQARIGCPAMWDGSQRQRLMEYARNAGLEVADGTLVDEPIAACVNWIERNRTRKIDGNVLIFDMGGGTLDVSFIRVFAQPGVEPRISVLSSMGRSEAGNQFDWHIASKIIEKVAGSDRYVREQLEKSMGRVFEVARQMKEDLLNNPSVSGTLNLPELGAITVTLTESEVADAIRGQVKGALEETYVAIRAGLITGMDIDRLDPESRKARKSEYSRLTGIEALKYVDHFVMAGGMVQMPLIRKLLVAEGVRESTIEFADNDNPGQAIAKGLGTDTLYRQMNLHVPSFSFFISWVDEESGKELPHELYKAHSRLVDPRDAFLGTSDFINRFESIKHKLPKTGIGKIFAQTLDGRTIPFDFDGVVLDGIEFRFGFQNEPVLRLSRNGEFYIKDTSEYGGKYYRLNGWPIVRREDGPLQLRNDPPEDHRDEGAGPNNNGPSTSY